MTEPHAGADPTQFKTSAVRDGDDWVINGWKFFSSNAKTASFLIVMVVTNPDVSAYQGMSMFLVPTDTPGVNIVRNVGLHGEREGEGSHALIHYDNVRVPAEALLGGEGQAFVIAQTRLGRRANSPRHAHDRPVPQGAGHDVRARTEPRDTGQPAVGQAVRAGLHRRFLCAAVAVPADGALHRVGDRQVQRLQEGPQGHRRGEGCHADGPARHRLAGNASARCARGHQRDAVHGHGDRRRRDGAGRRSDRGAQDDGGQAGAARLPATDDTWPTEWTPRKREAARAKYADYLENEVGNL